MQFTVVWDNVSFHRSALVQNWFQHHPQFTILYLPPYSLFLNPIDEFFLAWWWKVYDLRPQAQVPLIQDMEKACDQIDAAAVQGWIQHSRRFFPHCFANEDIACDVDEILWPDPARRRDDVKHFLYCIFIFSRSFFWYWIQCCLSDSLHRMQLRMKTVTCFVVILHVEKCGYMETNKLYFHQSAASVLCRLEFSGEFIVYLHSLCTSDRKSVV